MFSFPFIRHALKKLIIIHAYRITEHWYIICISYDDDDGGGSGNAGNEDGGRHGIYFGKRTKLKSWVLYTLQHTLILQHHHHFYMYFIALALKVLCFALPACLLYSQPTHLSTILFSSFPFHWLGFFMSQLQPSNPSLRTTAFQENIFSLFWLSCFESPYHLRIWLVGTEKQNSCLLL